MVIVVMAMDKASGTIVAGPDLVSRGFVYVRDAEELHGCRRTPRRPSS